MLKGSFLRSRGGCRFKIQRVVALFRCLSFITKFVEDSFDVAPGFLVLKNVPSAPRDFPGHFSGSGRLVRLVFAWFRGSRELGEGRLG